MLRAAIDNALAQKPADLDELLKLLRKSGCEVSKRGKSYRLKLPGWSKVSRLDSLGKGYAMEDLLAVLAGQKEHTPRQKPVKQTDPTKVNLLVDIQAKLQAGKGAGYVRWAKVFMGVKKLPKVKELQAEYARLLEEKKKTYAEYRRSREEMRELLAVKANVDRLLNMVTEHDTENEKDHDQR